MAGLEYLIQLKELDSENTAYELVCLVDKERNLLGGTFGNQVINGRLI